MILPPGSIIIIDHKTTSGPIEDGSPFWQRLRLDSQPSNYFVGARTFGLNPVAAMWDVIRKPRIEYEFATPEADRKYTKATKKEPSRLYKGQRETDEPLDEYRARLRADIEAQPDSYYRRGLVMRAEEDERDAALDVWGVAEQILLATERHQWPRNPDSCERFRRLCSYWPVCTKTARIDDPTRYRKVDDVHEELETGKRHLPLITTTGMKTFQRCAREYWYRYVFGYRPIEKIEALEFGTLVHLGLEAWWKTTSLEATFEALVTDNPVHRVSAEELLRGYHARWIDEPFDVLAVEAEFQAPLVHPLKGTSRTFELAGKIDAIARVGGRSG